MAFEMWRHVAESNEQRTAAGCCDTQRLVLAKALHWAKHNQIYTENQRRSQYPEMVRQLFLLSNTAVMRCLIHGVESIPEMTAGR